MNEMEFVFGVPSLEPVLDDQVAKKWDRSQSWEPTLRQPGDLYCTLSDGGNYVLWASADKFNLIQDVNGQWVPPTDEALLALKGDWRSHFWAELVDGEVYPMFFHTEDLRVRVMEFLKEDFGRKIEEAATSEPVLKFVVNELPAQVAELYMGVEGVNGWTGPSDEAIQEIKDAGHKSFRAMQSILGGDVEVHELWFDKNTLLEAMGGITEEEAAQKLWADYRKD